MNTDWPTKPPIKFWAVHWPGKNRWSLAASDEAAFSTKALIVDIPTEAAANELAAVMQGLSHDAQVALLDQLL